MAILHMDTNPSHESQDMNPAGNPMLEILLGFQKIETVFGNLLGTGWWFQATYPSEK